MDGLLELGLRVVAVRVQQIELLDPEPLQAVVDALVDVVGAEAAERSDLGREHQLVTVPARREPVADHGLGLASDVALGPDGVRIGGVDEVAAGRDVRVEHRERLLLVGRPTERVRAEAQLEHAQVGSVDRSHAGLLWADASWPLSGRKNSRRSSTYSSGSS